MSKILVVEDELALRDDISLILEISGHDVMSASNGHEGAELAQSELFDLIISDVTMPIMSGYDMLESIREQQLNATTPFVFLTAHADRASMRRGMKLGAEDYLTKPFTSSELLDTVSMQLQKRETLSKEIKTSTVEFQRGLVHTLPHEINTPLTGIIGLTQLLQTDDSMSRAEQDECYVDILQSAERLHRTLANVLLFAQIETLSDEQHAAVKTARCTDTAEQIASIANEVAQLYGRTHDLILLLEDAPVCIDRQDLQKVAYELIDNAFKFSEPGSAIYIRTERLGDQLVLRVIDRGRGMTAEEIARVGPYQQFNRSMYEQQGSGLGLAIVRKLLNLYDVALDIQERDQRGLFVSITLRCA